MRRWSLRPVQPKQGKSKKGYWTLAQRQYVNRCIDAGCILCGQPAQWHHERERFHGLGMRGPHEFGLPLCPRHHILVHENRPAFVLLAGETEAQLVDRVQKIFRWTP